MTRWQEIKMQFDLSLEIKMSWCWGEKMQRCGFDEYVNLRLAKCLVKAKPQLWDYVKEEDTLQM